jgi:hypothetical protein
VVFRTHRDRLAETMALLDEVERIETRSQTQHASGLLEQVHLWHGSPKVLPALIRPMVPPHLLQWRQRTWWDPVAHVARWQIDVPGLGEAVESTGTNTYELVSKGERTKITIAGEFHFRPERFEALARAMPPGTAPVVERVLVSLVVPLVKRSGSAVAKFLDEEGRR